LTAEAETVKLGKKRSSKIMSSNCVARGSSVWSRPSVEEEEKVVEVEVEVVVITVEGIADVGVFVDDPSVEVEAVNGPVCVWTVN
jgi:hypothetical protein